ncbi:SDR family oxidoreductase [Burkholderia ambifaria]|uniref:SDR family oxidoreductase n=1 Tax=Burkholderia ambifaria TaxID=152480 RepID=UPI001FC8C48E|nr:SDR family oxidoreductase [Burkholderia ambifaria]
MTYDVGSRGSTDHWRRRKRRAEGAHDIAERAQCPQLATQAIERFGRIDALVNSAFVHGTFPEVVEDADLDGWRAVCDTNVFGTMTLTQEIVPHMKRQKRGAIVMINTIATRKPFAGESGYAVSKGTLAVAAKYLARELGVHGIRANSIHMGWMWSVPTQTYFRQAAAEYGMTEAEIIAPVASNIALAKLPTDDDCARGAVPCVGLRERGDRRDAGCERRRFHALRREQRICRKLGRHGISSRSTATRTASARCNSCGSRRARAAHS